MLSLTAAVGVLLLGGAICWDSDTYDQPEMYAQAEVHTVGMFASVVSEQHHMLQTSVFVQPQSCMWGGVLKVSSGLRMSKVTKRPLEQGSLLSDHREVPLSPSLGILSFWAFATAPPQLSCPQPLVALWKIIENFLHRKAYK